MAFSAIANYEITLDSESGCFWPGDAVTGRLVLETTKPIKCRGIRIRLEGVGVGHWHTGGGDDRKDYHAEKKYVSKTSRGRAREARSLSFNQPELHRSLEDRAACSMAPKRKRCPVVEEEDDEAPPPPAAEATVTCGCFARLENLGHPEPPPCGVLFEPCVRAP